MQKHPKTRRARSGGAPAAPAGPNVVVGGGGAVPTDKSLAFLSRLATEFTAVLSLPDLLEHIMRVLRAHRERAGAFARADLDVLTVVGRYLTGAVEVARLHDQLKDLAATDSLTGLANRRCFFERFTVEIARSRRKDRPVTVVLLDLNGFKAVNDAHGHAKGDEVLIWVGEAITKAIRSYDLAARFGGDEFILMLPETTKEQA